ncbi:hypothetical protein [Pseudomonas sp. MF6747]|uniref:hypothetical protein n=1 Tax=Pseudomonas sp. MF6747 TaxID=2797527 RepID=UPI00190D4E70|nr:hypothetical protein [Pseudomonas sp. MF6747]MBK3509402.1 hypothetical protein [Pseudomonas sp. MF6747]
MNNEVFKHSWASGLFVVLTPLYFFEKFAEFFTSHDFGVNLSIAFSTVLCLLASLALFAAIIAIRTFNYAGFFKAVGNRLISVIKIKN